MNEQEHITLADSLRENMRRKNPLWKIQFSYAVFPFEGGADDEIIENNEVFIMGTNIKDVLKKFRVRVATFIEKNKQKKFTIRYFEIESINKELPEIFVF